MKNAIVDAVLSNGLVTVNTHSTGIFIINPKGELLLKCSSIEAVEQKNLWQAPMIFHEETSSLLAVNVQQFIKEFCLECDLHEAFTANHQSMLSPCGHIVIAFVKKAPFESYHYETNIFKWVILEAVLSDSREYPSRYAPWFRSSLEGVALFIKDLFYSPKEQQTIFCLQA